MLYKVVIWSNTLELPMQLLHRHTVASSEKSHPLTSKYLKKFESLTWIICSFKYEGHDCMSKHMHWPHRLFRNNVLDYFISLPHTLPPQLPSLRSALLFFFPPLTSWDYVSLHTSPSRMKYSCWAGRGKSWKMKREKKLWSGGHDWEVIPIAWFLFLYFLSPIYVNVVTAILLVSNL